MRFRYIINNDSDKMKQGIYIRKEDVKDFLKSALLAQLEEIKSKMPNKTAHWIQHGEIGHTHDTPEDSARNEVIDQFTKILDEMKKE
jgi:hypothetical protein